jgi:hypothetical protein
MMTTGTKSGKATAFPVYIFDGYPMENQAQCLSHLSLAGMPSTVQASTEIVARTNPSRPEVSMPNFLMELKEIPRALHDAGLSLIESRKKPRSGNSSVAYNFGWDLLIRDIRSMLDFTSQVDKRMDELTNLYNKDGYRRSGLIWTASATTTSASDVTYSSIDGGVQGRTTKTTIGKQWAVVRWRPDKPDIPSARELLATSRRVVHGWSFDPYGLLAVGWEALPWSWFGDYFGNVGTFLQASRNSVGAHPTRISVCTHIYSQSNCRITNNPAKFSVVPSSSYYDTKQRAIGSVGLTALTPFLGKDTMKKLVTLSSIAFNRGQNR